MSLPSYMRPETPQGDIPTFSMGEQIEAQIQTIEKVSGKYGDQLQIDVTFPTKNNWRGRAWIKYYPVPAPNQYLGKLCLAIQKVTKQNYTTLDAALNAIRTYGKIFLRVTGYNTVEGKINADGTLTQYPKFGVFPDLLPGETKQQTVVQQQPKPSGLPTSLPTSLPAKQSGVSQATVDWLVAHQDIIGKKIPPEIYNENIGNGVIEELHSNNFIEVVHDYPWISERARKLL